MSHATWFLIAVVINDPFNFHVLLCSNVAVAIMSSKSAKIRHIHKDRIVSLSYLYVIYRLGGPYSEKLSPSSRS